MPQAGRAQQYSSAGTCKWTEVVRRHRRGRNASGRGSDLHAGIVGRILDHVERYVSEVAFVADSVSPANARFAVAKKIVGAGDARGNVLENRGMIRRREMAGRHP